jgi:hypothetical protein
MKEKKNGSIEITLEELRKMYPKGRLQLQYKRKHKLPRGKS